MSAWAEVNAWRDEHDLELRRNAVRQLARCERHVWHARTKDRAWLYLTKAGELREWLPHQLAHARNFERVSMVALCTEATGAAIPALDGGVSNHLTRKLDRVTCPTCRFALDAEIEHGRIAVDENTLRFLRCDAPPLPRDDRGERCLLCKRPRETCGRFVGGGAL